MAGMMPGGNDKGSKRYGALVLLAYGAPALPLAALTLPVYIFLPPFYAQDLGLGLTLVGTILLLARLWDAVTDPIVGFLSDRIRGRHGRRRPWIVAAMPLTLCSVYFLLIPGPQAGGSYLLIWSLALYLGWTMMILPLSAWGAELSSDYNERTRIGAYREGLVVLGTLAALSVPLAVGTADRAGETLRVIAWSTLILLPLSVLLLVAFVPEPEAPPPRRLSMRRGYAILVGNRPFRRLLLAYLLNGVANGLPASLFLLFVQHVLQETDRAGLLLFTYFLCGVVAVPLWVRLSFRIGKHRAWIVAMLFNSAIFAFVPLLGPADFWPFFAICVLTGFCLGADLTLPSSMQADVVDQDTLRTGVQRTGLYFALWGMVTKLALALAVGIAFPLLDLAGFKGDVTGQGSGLWALTALYGLAPVAFKLAAIAIMWNYPIGAEMQAETRRRIDARSARLSGGSHAS